MSSQPLRFYYVRYSSLDFDFYRLMSIFRLKEGKNQSRDLKSCFSKFTTYFRSISEFVAPISIYQLSTIRSLITESAFSLSFSLVGTVKMAKRCCTLRIKTASVEKNGEAS